MGGTITNFDVKTELIENNISVALKNQVITQRDMDIVAMNEPWKKIVYLVIWIITPHNCPSGVYHLQVR